MMHYKIETGVPIPELRAGSPRRSQFWDMEIGQCLVVPKEDAEKMRHAVRNFKHRHPQFQLVMRTNAEGVLRVWVMAKQGDAAVAKPAPAKPAESKPARETDPIAKAIPGETAQRLRQIARLQPPGARQAHTSK